MKRFDALLRCMMLIVEQTNDGISVRHCFREETNPNSQWSHKGQGKVLRAREVGTPILARRASGTVQQSYICER
jgi:hypothetical protein